MTRVVDGEFSTAGGREGAEPRLQGHLNTLDIALATLAYAGPLTGTAGYITFLIGFGNGLGAPSAFLAIMVALLVFSVGYGAQTRYVPNPGAFYAYITAGLGKGAGLGSAFLILGSYIAIGVGFYGFAGLAAKQFVETWGGPSLDFWVYSLLFWAIVGSLAYFNIAVSAKLLSVLLIAEVLIVLVFNVLAFSSGGPEGISLEPFTWNAFASGEVGIALLFAVALFSGFEVTAIYREETKDPDRTIPRATMVVVLFIGLFYACTSWAFITALGNSQAVAISAGDPANAFINVAMKLGGPFFYDALNVLLLTSIFAAHLSIQNVTTRYVYSLAIDGVFPSFLGVAHPRHHSPSRASVFSSFVYLVLTAGLILVGLTGEQIYAWFAGLASFSLICAMTITSLAAFFYFRRNSHLGVGLWAGTIAPLLATAFLIGIAVLGVLNFPSLINGSQNLATVMLVAIASTFVAGFFYARLLKKQKPDVYNRIGRQ